MRSRLLPVLVAGLLTVPLLGRSPLASAEPRDLTGPALPATAPRRPPHEQRRSDALARAQALFAEQVAGRGARRQAAARRRRHDGAQPADAGARRPARRRAARGADALLARPTAPGGDGTRRLHGPPRRRPVCARATDLRPLRHHRPLTRRSPADTAPANGIPTRSTGRWPRPSHVHGTYVDARLPAPRPRRRSWAAAAARSTSTSADLGDPGPLRLLHERPADQDDRTSNRWAYCVIDDDFSPTQFPSEHPDGEPAGHAGPRVLPRRPVRLRRVRGRLVHGGHRHLGRGRALRRRRRQPAVPAGRPARRTPTSRWTSSHEQRVPVRQLDLLPLPHRALARRRPAACRTLVLELWQRASGRDRRPGPLLHAGRRRELVASAARRSPRSTASSPTRNRDPGQTYSEGARVRRTRPSAGGDQTRSSPTATAPDCVASGSTTSTSVPVRLKPARWSHASRDWKLRVRVDMPADRPPRRSPGWCVYQKNGGVSSTTLSRSSGRASAPRSSPSARGT